VGGGEGEREGEDEAAEDADDTAGGDILKGMGDQMADELFAKVGGEGGGSKHAVVEADLDDGDAALEGKQGAEGDAGVHQVRLGRLT
jgi:acyl-CoA reductase-like NAD-dependent aldehyde dehydrogenase